MTNNLKCPFCQQELCQDYTGIMYCCNEDCEQSADWYGSPILWQALIQSQQQLKMLEPIVASLQGRADINAEVARDSNELVVQWYEKYEQTQKDLEIATKALESISGIRENIEDYYGGVSIHYQQMVLHMDEIATNALEQIKHKE